MILLKVFVKTIDWVVQYTITDNFLKSLIYRIFE